MPCLARQQFDRLFRDDKEQFRTTVRALTVPEGRNEYCYVPDIVWVETCRISEKVYKFKRQEITDALAERFSRSSEAYGEGSVSGSFRLQR